MNYPDSFSGPCDAARFKGRRGTALPSRAYRGSKSASPLRNAFLLMGRVPIVIHALADGRFLDHQAEAWCLELFSGVANTE
jgi:hypothetical protein